MERKLATIEVIEDLWNHPNADLLDLARVRGWQCVVKKGEFAKGDKVIYFEIDSFIPTELAPFLSKGKEPRVFEGIKGERLKTIRLRGALSQGLILPISILGSVDFPLEDGTDVSKHLGVIKWELPLPAQLQGQVEGNFPSWIPKTDQERCQNCYSEMAYLDNYEHGGIDWNVEEKLDGCLTDAAMISTNKGYVSISEIVDNHQNYKVKTYNVDDETIEFSDIVNVMKTPNDGKQWYRLTLEDERVIDITGNHKVYLPKLRCWRRVDELEENDIFLIE